MRSRRRSGRLRATLVLVVAAGVAGGSWSAVATGKPAIPILVEGRAAKVAVGSTLADAARRNGLLPRAGDLLDVDGHVLQRGAVPGRLLLDGRPALGSTVIQAGDRIAARDGMDRREPLTRKVARAAVRRIANPQFYVELVPGRSIVTRGAISHRLLSATFARDGPPVPDDAVALTFDDGPSLYTRRFVTLLMALHVPATFFVIGTQAETYPDLVRLELDSGMVVGNHSYDHPWRTPFAELPQAEIESEIGRAQEILDQLGTRTVLFRPPGGTVSPFVLRTAAAYGLRIVLWSVDARDWVAGTTADEIVRRVLGAVGPGSIVVLHDGGGDREATLAALPEIVAGIRQRGLRLVALAPLG